MPPTGGFSFGGYMGISAIFKGIIAIANVIPAVKQMIEMFVNMYHNYNAEKIEQQAEEKKEDMNEAINQAGNAQTDEDRKKALAAIVAARNK